MRQRPLSPRPSSRLRGPRLGALLALCAALSGAAGCAAEDPGPYDLTSCSCTFRVGAEEYFLLCGQTRCIAEQTVGCRDDERPVVQGACTPPPDAGALDPEPPVVGRDLGPEPDLGCQPGQGRCDNNTFIPCDPSLPHTRCRAQVCVPSGQGPEAGCLSPAGYPCDNYGCVPGLVCDEAQICRRPPECEPECATEGALGCASPQRPARCRRDPDDGCLRWLDLDSCPDAEACAAGQCVAFCRSGQATCGARERCEDALRGCVADGTGFAPAGAPCAKPGDCAVPGSVCGSGECLAPCARDEDCLSLGLWGCCDRPSSYGLCRSDGRVCSP